MTDATTDFFDELARQGHEPRLAKANGTVRFDLEDGARTRQWLVTIKRGDVTVSKGRGHADCIIRAQRTLFDRLVTGEANAMASVIRGVLIPEGNPELLVSFQRLFPGPEKAAVKRRAAGYARKQS